LLIIRAGKYWRHLFLSGEKSRVEKNEKMSLISILIVCSLSFIVSILSISVGGTSLITVPVLISLGMISKNAVAKKYVRIDLFKYEWSYWF